MWKHPSFRRDDDLKNQPEIELLSKKTEVPGDGGAVPGLPDDSSKHAAPSDDGNHSDTNSKSEEGQDNVPEPKFDVFQSVMARDQDGVVYEAVVRRRLYGANHRRQVQLAFVSSDQEVPEQLAQQAEPMWHYFVHYKNWNVNWVRLRHLRISSLM